jgi:hypothetical protein
VAKIGDEIFLHGGIHPNLAHLKLDTINSHIRDEIKAFDSAKQGLVDQKVILPFFTLQEISAAVQAELTAERKSLVPSDQQRQARLVGFLGYGDWLSVRVDGPLWFRGYDQWSEEEGAAQIGKVLESYNAKRIVVGHTVQKGGRMRNRFGNRVFLIDTGRHEIHGRVYGPAGGASRTRWDFAPKRSAWRTQGDWGYCRGLERARLPSPYNQSSGNNGDTAINEKYERGCRG